MSEKPMQFSDTWRLIQIAHFVGPGEIPRPYRLIETYMTSEGPRTRVCSGAFRDFEEANRRLTELEAGTCTTNP